MSAIGGRGALINEQYLKKMNSEIESTGKDLIELETKLKDPKLKKGAKAKIINQYRAKLSNKINGIAAYLKFGQTAIGSLHKEEDLRDWATMNKKMAQFNETIANVNSALNKQKGFGQKIKEWITGKKEQFMSVDTKSIGDQLTTTRRELLEVDKDSQGVDERMKAITVKAKTAWAVVKSEDSGTGAVNLCYKGVGDGSPNSVAVTVVSDGYVFKKLDGTEEQASTFQELLGKVFNNASAESLSNLEALQLRDKSLEQFGSCVSTQQAEEVIEQMSGLSDKFLEEPPTKSLLAITTSPDKHNTATFHILNQDEGSVKSIEVTINKDGYVYKVGGVETKVGTREELLEGLCGNITTVSISDFKTEIETKQKQLEVQRQQAQEVRAIGIKLKEYSSGHTIKHNAVSALEKANKLLGEGAEGAFFIYEDQNDKSFHISRIHNGKVESNKIEITPPNICTIDGKACKVSEESNEILTSMGLNVEWKGKYDSAKAMRRSILALQPRLPNNEGEIRDEFVKNVKFLSDNKVSCEGAFVLFPDKENKQIVNAMVVHDGKIENYTIDIAKVPGKIVIGQIEYGTVAELKNKLVKLDFNGLKVNCERLQKKIHDEGAKRIRRADNFAVQYERPIEATQDLAALLERFNEHDAVWVVRAGKAEDYKPGVVGTITDWLYQAVGVGPQQVKGLKQESWVQYFKKHLGSVPKEFFISVLQRQPDGKYVSKEYKFGVDPNTGKLAYNNVNYASPDEMMTAIQQEIGIKDLVSYGYLKGCDDASSRQVNNIKRFPGYHDKGGEPPYAPKLDSSDTAQNELERLFEFDSGPVYAIYPNEKNSERTVNFGKGPALISRETFILSKINDDGEISHYSIDPWENPGEIVIKDMNGKPVNQTLQDLIKGSDTFTKAWGSHMAKQKASDSGRLAIGYEEEPHLALTSQDAGTAGGARRAIMGPIEKQVKNLMDTVASSTQIQQGKYNKYEKQLESIMGSYIEFKENQNQLFANLSDREIANQQKLIAFDVLKKAFPKEMEGIEKVNDLVYTGGPVSREITQVLSLVHEDKFLPGSIKDNPRNEIEISKDITEINEVFRFLTSCREWVGLK